MSLESEAFLDFFSFLTDVEETPKITELRT